VWTPMASGVTRILNGIWGSGPADVFAVGNSGTILHYGGAAWAPMASGVTGHLRAVWGSGPTDVFAVGSSGTILHYDGDAWIPMASGVTGYLNGVWGSGPSDVFVVGQGGTVLHYDGAAWSAMGSGTGSWLSNVWGNDADSVLAVGEGGTILRYGPPTRAIALAAGWNAVSLPLEPLDPAVGAVLALSGSRGTVHEGSAWRWVPAAAPGEAGRFERVTDMTARTGHWVYCPTECTVTVTGAEVANRLELKAGWNLLGPAATCHAPEDEARIQGAIWNWDAALPGFRAVPDGGTLEAGKAYWFRATTAFPLDL